MPQATEDIMEDEKFTFFWSGPFSQWTTSAFVINGIKYNCAEQFMMHMKALHFGDKKTAAKIMKASHPREQKALGREVNPFNEQEWNNVARDYVFKGNYAKFVQNPDLLKILLDTVGTTLVEASPKDKIWGIGLAEDHPSAKRRETWCGKNWLGETLTKVRQYIIDFLVEQSKLKDSGETRHIPREM